MKVIVRRTGRKLGNVRDARKAHAIHNEAVREWKNRRKAYDVAFAKWDKLMDEGKVSYGACPQYPDPVEPTMPNGWVKLGQGSYRTAYLSPDGVVYKVNNRSKDGRRARGYNYAEVRNIIRIKSNSSVPRTWAVPDATLYRVSSSDYVAAMPLLDITTPLNNCYAWGDDECTCANAEGNKRIGGTCTARVLSEGESLGFRDMHTKNVFPSADGVLWVVDCGL